MKFNRVGFRFREASFVVNLLPINAIDGSFWITSRPSGAMSMPFTCETLVPLVINHLTRMQQGYICVAGVDLETGRHVRPVLRRRMGTVNLVRNGGLFDMAR